MPSRYLLIEFDNEAQADALRAKIDTATTNGKSYRVVGVFAKPTRVCQCYREARTLKDWNIQRGTVKGWWMCPDCRKPILRDHRLINLLTRGDIISPQPVRGAGVHTDSYPPNSIPRNYDFLPKDLLISAVPSVGVEEKE